MMKGLPHVEENMSNLTSASGEAAASVSSDINGAIYPPHYFQSQSQPTTTTVVKKKRNQPGHPGSIFVFMITYMIYSNQYSNHIKKLKFLFYIFILGELNQNRPWCRSNSLVTKNPNGNKQICV